MLRAATMVGSRKARYAVASLAAALISGSALAAPRPLPAMPAGPAVVYVQAERGMTKDQFIARAQQRAAQQGRDPQQVAARAARAFDMADTNHDGILDRAEFSAFKAAHQGMGGGPGGPAPQR